MFERISVDPTVHFGKPCIAGTRVKMQDVLELVNAGVSFNDIVMDCYPNLTVEDVHACVAYAGRGVRK